MDQPTGAERYFDEQLRDPVYRDAYERADREVYPSAGAQIEARQRRLRSHCSLHGPFVKVCAICGVGPDGRMVPKRPNPTIVEVDSSPGWLRAVVILVWSGVVLMGVYAALLAGGVIR